MKKVLIVDDEQSIVELLSESLSMSGYECLGANSVDEAKEILNQFKDVNVLLSDVVMPGETGKELVNWLKETNYAQVNIFFMTGYSSVDRAELFGMGITDIISKPFDLNQLTSQLDLVVQQKSA